MSQYSYMQQIMNRSHVPFCESVFRSFLHVVVWCSDMIPCRMCIPRYTPPLTKSQYALLPPISDLLVVMCDAHGMANFIQTESPSFAHAYHTICRYSLSTNSSHGGRAMGCVERPNAAVGDMASPNMAFLGGIWNLHQYGSGMLEY